MIINKGWSVSCTYDFESDNTKKTYNGQEITQEFTNGKFLHLAIVPDPRYERANIVFNAKDKEQAENYNENHDEEGRFCSDTSSTGKKQHPEFGQAYAEFSYKPKEAINHLLSVKQGYVPNAVTKEGIGDIDFVYGKTGKAGYGLAHIIEQRDKQGTDGIEFVKTLPDILENGEVIEKENHTDRKYILSNNREAAIRLDYNGEKRNWIVTAYIKKELSIDNSLEDWHTMLALDSNLNVMDGCVSTTTPVDNIITNNTEDFNPEIKNNKAENNTEDDKITLEQFTNVFCAAVEEVLYTNTVNNGWITLTGKVDEEGNPLRVYIPSYIPQGGAATDFFEKMTKEKNKDTITYEFSEHTRANVTEEQQNHIKNTVNNVLSKFKVEPPLKGVNVCTIGGGCLGVAITSADTRTVSLDSKIFKTNGIEAYNNSIRGGWLAKTDKDVLTYVLTHELGHTITAGTDNKDFWDNIKDIKSAYCKDVKIDDISNPNYISKYARQDKDEFVAECFAQASLLKNPSRYAKMVLDEVNTHFLNDNKKEKQLRLFNALKEVLKMNKNIINNKSEDKKTDEITWVEGGGIGFCLTEEDYEKRKKEVEKHTKKEIK